MQAKKVLKISDGFSDHVVGTAAQIVPAIVEQTKTLTQIIRSPQWILPSVDFTYSPFLQWIFRNIPLALRVHRLQIFAIAETDVRLVRMTKRAAKLRAARREVAERYMRDTAPEKYHDILIPDFEYGCKVRDPFPLALSLEDDSPG